MPRPLRIVSPLHKGTRRIGEYMRAASHEHGIEPGEAHLLSYVTVYGPCPVSQLVQVFGHKPSTLTGILDRLEARSMVERIPNEADRRSFLVRVTPAGSEAAIEMREMLERLEADIEAAVGPEKMAGFEAVLDALQRLTEEDPS